VRRNRDEPFFVYPLIIYFFSVPWVARFPFRSFQIIFFRRETCIVLPSWFHRFPLPQKKKKYTFLSLDLSSRRVTVTLLVPDADSDSGNGPAKVTVCGFNSQPADDQ